MTEINSSETLSSSHEIQIDFPELKQLPSLASAAEVARFLKCSKRHVLNECNAGRMAFILIAGRFLITPDSIKNYIQGRIQPCRKETKAPISNGSKKEMLGTSCGTAVDVATRNQRALEIASRLTRPLADTTSK